MKNFKKIVAIVLVVMMVVPMLTTGLTVSAADGDQLFTTTSNYGNDIGGWRVFGYSDGALQPGQDYVANRVVAEVTSQGQLSAYSNNVWDFAYPTNARTALMSTNYTAINGMYVINSNINSHDSGGFNAKPKVMSYAFSEQPLQGALNPTTFTLANGFTGAMVTDGIVFTLVDDDASNTYFDKIVASEYAAGELVATQTLDGIVSDAGFGIETAHPNVLVFGLSDGIPSVTLRDSYSSFTNPQYIIGEYIFSDLVGEYKTGADYYFSVGTGSDFAGGDTSLYGSNNITLSRIGLQNLDADRKVVEPVADDNACKNVYAFTGNGTPSCAHTWGEPETITAGSCTEYGFYKYTCTACSKTEIRTQDPLGHDWTDWTEVTPATCTAKGSQERYCKVCPETETRSTSKLGHDKYETERVPATCFDDGYYDQACTRCDKTWHTVIPATGDHTWVYTYIQYPTVDEDGLANRKCAACTAEEFGVTIEYELDFYWSTAAKNVVSNLNPAYTPYNNNAYFEGNGNGVQAQDMTCMYDGDFAYYPQNIVMSKFTTDLVYASVTVQPKTWEFSDGTIGYPSAIGYAFTTHPEEYNAPEKTSAGAYGAQFGLNDYFLGFYNGQAMGGNDGEYTLTLTLTDNVDGSNGLAGFAGGAAGTADDGYYEQLCWIVVNNDNFTYYGGVTLATPIAAGDAYTLQLCRDYDSSTGNFVFGVYIPETAEYVDLGGAVSQIAVDQQYYIGVEAYGYGANQHNATFDVVDINGINAANYYGGYKHECEFTHSATPATCTGAGTEFDICIYCGAKINVVNTPATGHDFDSETGVCKNGCGTTSTVKADGVFVTDMTEAIEKVAENGTITLTAKTKTTATLNVDKAFTLDLNGKTLYSKNMELFKISSTGNLTVNGNGGTMYTENDGSVEAECIRDKGNLTIDNATVYTYNKDSSGTSTDYTIYVDTGHCTINGGTIYNRASSSLTAKAAVYNNKGYVYINGGTFYTRDGIGNPSTTACYKVKSAKETVITGGTFKQYDPSAYVPEGYEAINDGSNNYTVQEVVPETPFSFTADDTALSVEIGDIKEVKQYFIGFGTLNTYRDVKNNLMSTNSYSKTFYEVLPGEYTCCVRYTDGTEEFYYATVDTEEVAPVFASAGSVINFQDLQDTHVIRIANGELTTMAEIKADPSLRTLTEGMFVENTASFNLLKSGTYTIATVSKKGAVSIQTITITAYSDGVTITNMGNKAHFSGVSENVKAIRYAQGEYDSNKAVKSAPDCRQTGKTGEFDSKILAAGTYTFAITGYDNSVCIQVVEIG